MDYRFLLISRAVSTFVALSGLLVMVGWLFGFRSLTTLYGSVPIGVGTALATLLAGSILRTCGAGGRTARQSFLFRAGAGLVLGWGVLSLLCHFLPEDFGAGMGIDLPSELGLAGPATSVTFAAFGLAMLIFDRIALTWLGEALASLVGLVGLLAFTGYLYGVPAFYQLGAYRVMPLPIAVNFCLLSLAYMLSRTDVGFGAIVFSKTIAGAVARRLLPATILIPVLLGWLHLLAEKLNLFSADFGTALVVLAFIVFFTIATKVTTHKLAHLETINKQAEAEQTRMQTLRADAAEILQHPTETQELLQEVAGLLVQRLDAAFARVWTLDSTGTILELQASAGLYTHRDGAHSRVPVGQYKIGKIAQERRSLVTNQVLGDARVHNQEWVRREGMIAFAGFPLMREDRLLGVVALFAKHKLSPAEVNVFESVANLLAQALARKRAEQEAATLREHLESMVEERTVKLREAMEELEHFSYTITHDMRAPLRAMCGFGEVLLKECSNSMDPASRELMRRISDSALRMDHLITDALTYSRAAKDNGAIEPTDASALLRGIIESYPQLQRPQAEISVAENISRVMANEAGLTQCFSNLLDNAVKFVEAGKMPRVRVWAENRGEFVRFWFEDNGIGIDPEYHAKIFEMFERLNQTYSGTGIGLALVRKVVERMGGKVGVESAHGKGSRFWLEMRPAPEVLPEYAEQSSAA